MVREDERCLVADRLAEHRDTLAAFAADKPRLVDLIVYLIRTQMPDGLPGPRAHADRTKGLNMSELDLDEWEKDARAAIEWGINHHQPKRIVLLITEVRRLRALVAEHTQTGRRD